MKTAYHALMVEDAIGMNSGLILEEEFSGIAQIATLKIDGNYPKSDGYYSSTENIE